MPSGREPCFPHNRPTNAYTFIQFFLAEVTIEFVYYSFVTELWVGTGDREGT